MTKKLQINNVLIVKLSAIGDVIHALPVAAALKEANPQIHITWVVSPVAAPLLDNNPTVDEIIIFERKSLSSLTNFRRYIPPFRQELQKRSYDYSLDLQGLLKSALVVLLSKSKKKLGYANMREGSGLFSKAVHGPHQNGHIVERYLDVVRAMGYEPKKIQFPFCFTTPEITSLQKIKATYAMQKPFVSFVIGANWPNKRWPAQYFAKMAEFCQSTGRQIILLGAGKIDREIAYQIEQTSTVKIINLVDKTSLKMAGLILQEAEFSLGGDTGLMHMSAALNRPTFMLMGPTDPTRNGPYAQAYNVLTVPYSCQFCWKRRCPLKKDCLRAITPKMVQEKLINSGLI